MEVDDFELLELVNDYQERSDEPTFNTLDDIPEALMIEALDEANYIEDEINDYMMVDNTFRAMAESELDLYDTAGRPYFGEGAAEGMLDDVAIEGTCMLVRRMYEKCKVFIVTGREGTPEIIAATKKWLATHDIAVDELFFRPVKDYSPGAD